MVLVSTQSGPIIERVYPQRRKSSPFMAEVSGVDSAEVDPRVPLLPDVRAHDGERGLPPQIPHGRSEIRICHDETP